MFPFCCHCHRWQYKLLRVATRFGLLAEACLALLLLPILRGMAVFRLLGIQFEASVRYHIWLGTSMITFATLHGACTFFIWGVKNHIHDEVIQSNNIFFNVIKVFEANYFVEREISDVEMAKNGAYIPCWGDCSFYGISHLDNITSMD